MRAIVLAAGFGTRLGALSDERPKPLLPVADIPLLRYNLALLAAHGVREVAINLHHRGELIVEELASGAGGLAITWSREEVILGTGGGLQQVADWLTDGGRAPFLVLNGKLVIDVDLHAVVAAHQRTGAVATMVVREVPDAERWGAIDLAPIGSADHASDDHRVVAMLGENPGGGPVARRCMFTGVHVVEPALLRRLPPAGVESCVIRKGYLPALRDGDTIGGFLYDGYFQEHSTPARYLEGNLAVLRGEAHLRHPPGPLTGVDPSARVGEGVVLRPPYRIGAGAVVGTGATVGPDAVVGRGAEVAAGASLERAVAWPGAHVEGHVTDAIVTARGVFPVG